VSLHVRLAALAWLCGLLSLPSFSTDITLEVTPTPIVVSSSNFTAEARVILKNSGSEILRHVSLSQFSNDGIKAEIGKPCSTHAGPKRQIVWPVKISGPGNAHFPGSVIFEARYVSPTGMQHVYALLTLQTDGTQKPVEASLEGNLDAVSQQRPASVYLVVTNNLDVPVDVDVDHKVPQGAIIVSTVSPFQVQARSTESTEIEVKTKSRVTPGVYPVLLEVTANWNWAGRKERRHLTVSKPATIGVFFESELLKALGVPSFLVLPGCLMVFTFQFLLSFNILRLKDYSKMPDLGLASPGFWIIAVSLSGVFAYFYYVLTKVNYLSSYGVDDLRNVWLSSILIGFLIYFLVAAPTYNWRQSHIPTSSDSPIVVLKKLGKNQLGISLPRVIHHLGNQDVNGFVIEKIEDSKTMLWVAPRIAVTWQANAEAQREAFQAEFNLNGNPAELARILEAAGNQVTVEWEPNAAVTRPYHAKVEAITQYQPAEVILAEVG